MSDTVIQNHSIDSVFVDLDGAMKDESQKLAFFGGNSIIDEPMLKINTASVIENDKGKQDLIKPKFRIVSKKTNYSFNKKKAIRCMEPRTDDNANNAMPSTIETVVPDVLQEYFTNFLIDNNGNNQTQDKNLGFLENTPVWGAVENNMLNPTEYVNLDDVNIHMPTDETEIESSQQSVDENNIFSIQDIIPKVNISAMDGSWEFIKNTNILINTKYIVVKKGPNTSVIIEKNSNENLTASQTNSFEEALSIENIPKEDVGAHTFLKYQTKKTSKPKKYNRKPRDPNLKKNYTRRQRSTYTRKGKKSVPDFYTRKNLGKALTENNIPNQQIAYIRNTAPMWNATNNYLPVSPSNYTITETKSPTNVTFKNIINSEYTNVPSCSQLAISSGSKSVLLSAQRKEISVPTRKPVSSKIPKLVDSRGKAFLFVPLKKAIQQNAMRYNALSHPKAKMIYSLVPLDKIQIQKEDDNTTKLHMKPSESSFIGSEIIQGTITSNIGVKLVASAITEKKKRIIIRKRSVAGIVKNKPPVIIRKTSKYDKLIARYTEPIPDLNLSENTVTQSETVAVDNTATLKNSPDKIYSDIMNKFPLILPKDVSNNSGKQSDILERAIASINMDEFMLDEETHNYETFSQPKYTQNLDRNALSSEERASMFSYDIDPMLPQYSTRRL